MVLTIYFYNLYVFPLLLIGRAKQFEGEVTSLATTSQLRDRASQIQETLSRCGNSVVQPLHTAPNPEWSEESVQNLLNFCQSAVLHLRKMVEEAQAIGLSNCTTKVNSNQRTLLPSASSRHPQQHQQQQQFQ